MNNNLPPGYIEPQEHCQECLDQPENCTECICLDVLERKMDDDANNRVDDLLLEQN